MKNTLTFLVVCLLTFSFCSCKKSYSCECTSGAAAYSDEWEDLTKEESVGAEKACEANHQIAQYSDDSCSFIEEGS